MPELRVSSPRVVAVLASPGACDRLNGLAGACRIAPDEIMILNEASVGAVRHALRQVDPDATVVDVSDSWASLTLDGTGARAALAGLSELEVPWVGFVQGEVARIGLRILADGERVELLVPSMLADHVRALIGTVLEDPVA